MSDAPAFAPLNHPTFRRLSFQDQIRTISMYTYHRDDYLQACRDGGYIKLARQLDPSLDRALRKIEEGLAILDALRSEGPPHPLPEYDLQVIKAWGAYRCNYQRKPWLEVDQHALKVTHHYVVNVRLFNLPVLAMSARAMLLWSWLLLTFPLASCDKALRLLTILLGVTRDVPYEDLCSPSTSSKHPSGHFIRSYSAWKDEMDRHTEIALKILPQFEDLKQLWGAGYKLLDDPDSDGDRVLIPRPSHVNYHGFHISRRLALLRQPRRFENRVYLPMVPEFWFSRARNFHIQDWDLIR